MIRILTAAGASLLVVAGATGAVAQTGAGPMHKPMGDMTRAALVQRLDARFAALDANRDGTITRAEMQAAHAARRDARFTRLDTDGNGALSRTEFDAQRGGRGGGGRMGHGWHHGGMGMKDGQVTKADFEARALARFDRMDADHNGVVTSAERQAAWTAMKARRAQPSA